MSIILKTRKEVSGNGTETIKWLEENGGGIYRNILHNVEFYVSRRKK